MLMLNILTGTLLMGLFYVGIPVLALATFTDLHPLVVGAGAIPGSLLMWATLKEMGVV